MRRLFVVIGGAVVLLVLAACGGTPASSPTVSARLFPGTLVFGKTGGEFGYETIFVKRPGQPEHAYPGFGPGQTCCYRISPDRSRILFPASLPDGRITIAIEPFEGGPRRSLPIDDLTLNLGPGAWVGDGSRIAAEGWDDRHPRRSGIYVVDAADGAHRVRLTGPGVDRIPGSVSPDGRSLVFVDGLERRRPRLMTVPVDASRPARYLTPARLAAAQPAYSPDGTAIVFCTCRYRYAGDALWTVAPDGSRLHRLWHSDTQFAGSPAWSPDGTQIIFTLNDVAFQDTGAANAIAVIEADGEDLHEIYSDGFSLREVTWLP